jgi:acyl-CoA reductase-like NAD-dependent aldehyde dehydrogenase
MAETSVQAKDELYIAGRWVSASRTGTVTINTSIDFDFDFDAPYGGFKSSGTERELGGIEGILGFTEARAIGP